MPSSTYKIINQTIEEVLKVQPKSILDVGVGFGKYGFLCREYLETWKDRVFPNQWCVKIDGIDIFKSYLELEHNKVIYNNLYHGDAVGVLQTLDKYDMIIAMDVIEHMEKNKGIKLVKDILSKSNICIINIPTGDWLHNKIVANNPAEEHQAIWVNEDLEKIAQSCDKSFRNIDWEQNGKTGCL